MLDRLNRCLVEAGNPGSLVTILPRHGFTAAVPRIRSPSTGEPFAGVIPYPRATAAALQGHSLMSTNGGSNELDPWKHVRASLRSGQQRCANCGTMARRLDLSFHRALG